MLKSKNFVKNFIFPISDLILGQSVYSSFFFLSRSQWWSRDQLDDYQNQKLRYLIKHSVETVPYYSELFKKLKLSVNDIKSKSDLYKIPILTKEEIKKQGLNKFLSSKIPNRKLISMSSSGSTGEPLFYKTTKDAYSMNIASNLRGWSWMGFNIGDKYIKLSQNHRKNLIKRLQDGITRNLYLSINPLNDANLEYILKRIEDYKPDIIRCYPDPLLFLSRYKNSHLKFKHIPKAINTTGNTLYPEIRLEIEESFGCKVFDSYSSEGNSNVFECETHECYHSAEEYGISEVLDDNNNSITKGIGRLISTDLHNYAHPFIRYETQDQVELLDGRCSCGRNLLSYKRILGRNNDLILSASGIHFIVHNFTGFFMTDYYQLNKSVQQFQVIKTRDNKIIFNLVVNESFDEKAKSFIVDYWSKQLKFPINVNLVDNIKLTKSGKRKFIINE